MTLEFFLNLATALGVGLLIGTERSWSGRESPGQELVAGIRTFGLAGLFGGLAAVSVTHLGAFAWVAMFIVLGLLVIAGYLIDARRSGDHGMTTEVALLLTFLLGSLAIAESRQLAAACAIVVALLLSLKTRLHQALKRLSEAELGGALKMLFISVVLLPALPNQGYGPWQALNPYTTWMMVVLIAGIGFAAYVAIRAFGARHGLLVTALLGGIVSSTAMTITLARLNAPQLRAALAAGLLATSALMFPRVLLEVGIVNPALLPGLSLPLAAAGAIYAAGALFYYLRAASAADSDAEPLLKNPFELGPALRFAALLVLILLLVEGARRWFGDAGIYLVSLLAGLTDVDAITLSLASKARDGLAHEDLTVAAHRRLARKARQPAYSFGNRIGQVGQLRREDAHDRDHRIAARNAGLREDFLDRLHRLRQEAHILELPGPGRLPGRFEVQVVSRLAIGWAIDGRVGGNLHVHAVVHLKLLRVGAGAGGLFVRLRHESVDGRFDRRPVAPQRRASNGGNQVLILFRRGDCQGGCLGVVRLDSSGEVELNSLLANPLAILVLVKQGFALSEVRPHPRFDLVHVIRRELRKFRVAIGGTQQSGLNDHAIVRIEQPLLNQLDENGLIVFEPVVDERVRVQIELSHVALGEGRVQAVAFQLVHEFR